MEDERKNEISEQPHEKNIGENMRIEFKDTPSNRKALSVFARKPRVSRVESLC